MVVSPVDMENPSFFFIGFPCFFQVVGNGTSDPSMPWVPGWSSGIATLTNWSPVLLGMPARSLQWHCHRSRFCWGEKREVAEKNPKRFWWKKVKGWWKMMEKWLLNYIISNWLISIQIIVKGVYSNTANMKILVQIIKSRLSPKFLAILQAMRFTDHPGGKLCYINVYR